MDRKSKLNNQSVADSKRNGEERVEDALKKLHQMEWMRNKKDPHHLVSYQQHSREDVRQDRKKQSRDEEESYYEGTSKVKRERQRKPRQTNSTPSLLSSGFTQSATTGPPPVNAWQQKKGSALFVKPVEPGLVEDEEDYMLRQALEESIRTAENEKKTRELMRMYSYGEASPYQAIEKTGPWGNKSEEKKQGRFDREIKKPDSHYMNTAGTLDYGSSSRQNNTGRRPDLHFVNTADSLDKELSNGKLDLSKRPLENVDKINSDEDKPYYSPTQPKNISRPKKSFSPQEKVPHNETKANPEIYQSDLSTDYSDDGEDNYESPKSEYNFKNYTGSFKSNMLQDQKSISPKPDFENPVTKTNQELKKNSSIDDLSRGMNNALTFGDTQGLFDDVQGNNHLSFSDPRSDFSFGPSRYEVNPETSKPKTLQASAFPSSMETDELLHSFIRKDPPSNVAATGQGQMSDFDRNPVYPASQLLGCESLQQHHLLRDENLLPDSSSPLSNSPAQNSPFGSFENQLLTGMAGQMHVQPSPQPFQYPLNFLPNNGNSLQNTLPNHRFMAQMPYSNTPSGYGVSNLTNPLLTQLGATNPNMIAGMNETNPLLANPNMIPSLNDVRSNISMLQAMNQNLSALVSANADPKMMTSLGNSGLNQNLTSSLNDLTQNPNLTNQATNPNLVSSSSNQANKPDLMSFMGANSPALTNQATHLNMVPKVDQASQLYQAQMMANYNYYARLQYQAQAAALAGNVKQNENSRPDQPQPSFLYINHPQNLPKEAPHQQFLASEISPSAASESQTKALMQATLQNQVNLNPLKEQTSQPNSFFSDFQTQASLQNQAQQAVKNEDLIKLKMQLLAKEFSDLEKSLNSNPDPATTTPMPVAPPPVVMPPQYSMYPPGPGQFVAAPVMGMHSYYPVMPVQNAPQLSPNTQPSSLLFNMPTDDVRLQQ